MLSKITRPLNMVDSVILVYTLLLTFHTIVSIPKLTAWDIHLLPNFPFDVVIPAGVLFIPVMNWIYANLDQGGGAFPSLHAAAAVIMSRYAIKFFPKWKIPLILFLFAILIATVVCTFHYTIDILAGSIISVICFLAGPKLYTYLSPDAI